MVEIVDGLKATLLEIDTKIALLRREIGALEDQKDAFVKVIIGSGQARRSYLEPPVSSGKGVVGIRPQDGNALLDHVQISVRHAGHRRTTPSEDGSER